MPTKTVDLPERCKVVIEKITGNNEARRELEDYEATFKNYGAQVSINDWSFWLEDIDFTRDGNNCVIKSSKTGSCWKFRIVELSDKEKQTIELADRVRKMVDESDVSLCDLIKELRS